MTFQEAIDHEPIEDFDQAARHKNCVLWSDVDLDRWEEFPDWACVLSPSGTPVQKSLACREMVEELQTDKHYFVWGECVKCKIAQPSDTVCPAFAVSP